MSRFTEKMLKDSIEEVNALLASNKIDARFVLHAQSGFVGYNEISSDGEHNGERGTPREVNNAMWSRARLIIVHEQKKRLVKTLSDLVQVAERGIVTTDLEWEISKAKEVLSQC